MSNECFVFAVCGGKEHISALNLSLRYLRHFTGRDIIVVTDMVRNKEAIDHSHIVDYLTPTHLNNKEAAIFLKTKLPDILPAGPTYCYLDSDVLAVNMGAGNVFRHFEPPVIFASDHCPMDEFSPGCVHCGCTEKGREEHNHFRELASSYQEMERAYIKKYVPSAPEKHKRYLQLMDTMKEYGERTRILKKFSYLKNIMPVVKPYPYSFGMWLKRHGGFTWDRFNRRIYDTDGTLLYDDAEPYPDFRGYVEQNSRFNLDDCRKIIMNGKDYYYFYVPHCTHLHTAIKDKFNINVTEIKWRHWNGGLFLFNETAREFFHTWHENTLAVFNDPYWEKRDQGTLIAAAWKFKWQHHYVLPQEFNFIADYSNEFLRFDPERGFSMDNFQTAVRPSLVHIYHHFGDANWKVWQWIESLLPPPHREVCI